ncbi:hypothetical protein PP707_00550 [Acetobacter pasteurianus]|nr:hypothetical protein [Acetobacter pasteurianus]
MVVAKENKKVNIDREEAAGIFVCAHKILREEKVQINSEYYIKERDFAN